MRCTLQLIVLLGIASLVSAQQPISQVASTPVSVTLQNAAGANGNGTVLNVSGMGALIVTVNITAGAIVNFEASEDGTNFTPVTTELVGAHNSGTNTNTIGVTIWEAPVSGFQQFRARISGWSSGTVTVTAHAVPLSYSPKDVKADVGGTNGATVDSTIGGATAPTNAFATSTVYQTTVPALSAGQAVAVQGDTTGSTYVNTENRRTTYRASTSITPIAAAAEPLFLVTGSASKTIRITRLNVQVYCTTGTALPATVTLVKFSSITGGTAAALTKVPVDSGFAAATATVATYAGGLPTANTAVGNLQTGFVQWVTGGATVAQPTSTIDWYFGDKNGSSVVLRGTSQFLGFFLSGIGTTPIMAITVEWVEDNS